MQNEKIINHAKEVMPEFEVIINLFDMTFVYISEECASIGNYTPKEMIGKHISNFMTADLKSEEFQNIIMNAIRGSTIIPIKSKSGNKIEVTFEYKTIKVNNEPFLVTRAVR